jgi:hypothetical protein
MSHNLGPIVQNGTVITHNNGLDLDPPGTPHFVMLHFDSVQLNGGAKLTVALGYDTDSFGASAGGDFWSRPADPGPGGKIAIRIVGGTGSARLKEYGKGEPTVAPPTVTNPSGSTSNPDVFLHASPYEEPDFETRLECTPGFAWVQAACGLAPSVPDVARERVKAATGIIVEVHDGHVSSCSGTLIGSDLFLTARHCLTDSDHADLASASVTFDYHTNCDRTRPAGHVTRFHKVIAEVAFGEPPMDTTNIPVANDWVVVRLDAPPGALPPPLEMRDAQLMANETIFTMHHPNGAAKKTQTRVHGGGDQIRNFDFAGGSSGSALFDVNGRLVRGPLANGGGCGVFFAPLAPIKAALTAPPPPPVPFDVMVVFDRSGSMASTAPPVGRTKLDEAQDAAALFIQLVREGQGDRLGLVTFSAQAALDAGLAPAATAKPALVGPPPFTTGKVGAIAAGGTTSMGAGLGAALLGFGAGSGNTRGVLLLSDGLENTVPMVAEIEPFLGTTRVNVIGFGSDAEIDGPLLNRLARDHGGQFTRSLDGLTLRKFFGLAFGNIFENGALSDPEAILHANQAASDPHRFGVCGEERITVILGWDDPAVRLRAQIRTPAGNPLNPRQVRPVQGRSWVFYRIPLPHQGERDGTWQFTVERVPTGGEFGPPPTDVRYFFLVVCAGGPRLVRLEQRKRLYTGDRFHPMVALHYPDRTVPHHAKVELFIDAPGIALGQLTTEAGLRPPETSGDAVDAFHATLQAVARGAGGTLPVSITQRRVVLHDDGEHEDGALEPDGIFNHPLPDLTKVEGTYHFRAVAMYGENCRASREALWSVHVEPGIDPGRTTVTLDGDTLVLVPRDRYGNPLGPGRGDRFTVSPLPGVSVTGPVQDKGDGSYQVPIAWDPASVTPGVIVQQPERPAVPLTPTGSITPPSHGIVCAEVAGELLECLGLRDPSVTCVRVKSVSIEVELKDKDCGRKPDC